MAYSTSQTTRIKEANNDVNLTKSEYETAQKTLAELDTKEKTLRASVFKCNGYRNTIKNIGLLSPGDCTNCVIHSNCPDCKGINVCKSRVIEYNGVYKIWNAYKSTVTAAKTAYEEAKTELENVLNNIAKETNNDPQVILANNQIKAQKDIAASALKSRTVQIAIFGGIALIIIVIMVVVLRK